MKKIVSMILIAAMTIGLLAGCTAKQSDPTASIPAPKEEQSNTATSAPAPEEVYTIRVSTGLSQIQMETIPQGVALQAFIDNVEERSEGRVVFDVYPDGQLGSKPEQYIGGCQNGAFEVATVNCAQWASYTDAFMAMNFPFLFSTSKVARGLMDGPFGVKVKEKVLEDTGLTLLMMADTGFRDLTNSVRPIKTPEDMKGLKIRVMSDPYQIAAIESLGAVATPLPYSEVFTALQQKLVDGQENPLATILTAKFYEVQKYLTLSHHSYSFYAVAINTDYFKSLPEDIQTIILEESYNAEQLSNEVQEQLFEDALTELKKTLEVYELSPEEFNAFKTVAMSSWTAAQEAMDPEMYDLLMSEVARLENLK
jgi:C4-dicarboxylate-binding protein DctP